jgi:dephospho-CoA kinase
LPISLPDGGAALVDTDAIAHELTGPQGAAMAAIAAAFGAAVLRPDGGLDRAAMRAVVFSRPLRQGEARSPFCIR